MRIKEGDYFEKYQCLRLADEIGAKSCVTFPGKGANGTDLCRKVLDEIWTIVETVGMSSISKTGKCIFLPRTNAFCFPIPRYLPGTDKSNVGTISGLTLLS